jgi:hypothetical protein
MGKNKAEIYFESELKRLDREKDLIYEELEATRANKMVLCHNCKKRTKISKITYIQTRWYTPPHGCMGGDYWQDGEGQFDCPKCGWNNRLYERPEVEALKRHFKDVVKKCKD